MDSEIQDILVDCYKDTSLWCKVFYPDIFYADFDPPHKEIFDALDHCDARKIVIAAPRGLGKTSIMRAFAGKMLMYKTYHFLAYGGQAETHAMMQTENIKRELTSSQEIKKLFGQVKVRDSNLGLGDEFSKKAWMCGGSGLVVPRGSGQAFRGLNWSHGGRAYRPDLIIMDDLEEKLTLDNEEIRRARKAWLYADVLKSVSQIEGDAWRIIYIDTVKHEDSLIETLMADPDWEHIRLSICTPDYKTLAPSFKSQASLDKDVEQARALHQLDIFAMESMSIATSTEDAAFKSDQFKYYSETDADFIERLPYIDSILIIDPSKTKKPQSAETGMVVWGIDTAQHKLYLRYAAGHYITNDEMYDKAFDLADTFGCRSIAVEKTGIEEYIIQPMRNRMVQRGKMYNLIPLSAQSGKAELSGLYGGKAARVRSLIPYYQQGQIFHNVVNTGAYETQLISYPRPRRWDIIDAAAYIVKVMEDNMVYFLPHGDDDKIPVDEYAGVEEMWEDEEPQLNWRIA
jgi:hypothetical protein